MTQHEVIFGKKKIQFTIEYRKRKTLEISVLPDKTVKAVAPENADLDKIIEKVSKRASWIIKQQNYFTQFYPKETARKYVSGETHRYLGRQYLLKIQKSDKEEVKLKGRNLIIYTLQKDNSKHIEKLLYAWYKSHAQIKFEKIIDNCLVKLSKYDIVKPEFKIKKMKSRWGSCNTSKKQVLLNTELIKAPTHGIEYVIMHELCHLKYPNHDKKFYGFLDVVMPDWKQRKERLEKAFS